MKYLRLSQTIRNIFCGDFVNSAFVNSTGSNRIKKVRVGVPPGIVWGNRGGGLV